MSRRRWRDYPDLALAASSGSTHPSPPVTGSLKWSVWRAARSFWPKQEPSRRFSWEEVFECAPEVLVLMPCGFDVGRTLKEARVLPALPGWEDLPAVKDRRVWVVDANSYFSRPAPRLIEGVEILARIFHPQVFPAAPTSSAAPFVRLPQSGTGSGLDR